MEQCEQLLTDIKNNTSITKTDTNLINQKLDILIDLLTQLNQEIKNIKDEL